MIKKKNNETRKPKGKGRGPSQQEFESKCSAGEPASRACGRGHPLTRCPPAAPLPNPSRAPPCLSRRRWRGG